MSGATGSNRLEDKPRVAVIIPAFKSDQTIAGCLETISSQSYPAVEIILVDSSPDVHTTEAIETQRAHIQYIHSGGRLLPHAARNLGAKKTQAELLVFTDPDIYAPPGWLDALVRAQRQFGGVIVGSIACRGRHWLDLGAHLAKFDLFLPGGGPRPLTIAATANMMCTRSDFVKMGGFEDTEMLADTLASWAFTRMGIPITFVPGARVEHHHVQSWIALLEERFTRGRDFGRLRVSHGGRQKSWILRQLILTILPFRLVNLSRRLFLSAVRAGMLIDFLLTLPISLSAQSAWLMGEIAAYMEILRL